MKALLTFKEQKMASKSEIKLTKAQRKVIELLQRGEVIVHDDRYYQVSDGFERHRIAWNVWQALTQDLDLIYQEMEYPFHWLLTKQGENFKFKTNEPKNPK
jgi:hypothetical protein